MNLEGARVADEFSAFEQLRFGREILLSESRAIQSVAASLGQDFCRAADLLFHCRGSLIVSGMGKAGLIGQKLMATFASTGTPSHFLHPAEAVHGDLGRLRHEDVVLVLSQSGETEEILRLLPSLQELGTPIISMTARAESTLGRVGYRGAGARCPRRGRSSAAGTQHEHDDHACPGRCVGPRRESNARVWA
jgi:arabinose-5-phosphate isomerase